MKAWVLREIGNIVLESRSVPQPGPGEVLVKVRSVGICGSDIPRIYKNGAHRMPLVPGHEFAGSVEQVGSGVDESLMGERVGVFPLIPCGKCGMCKKVHYEMCADYDYIGSRRDGAFAEYVRVPEWNVIKLPDEVSFEEASMLEPMAVAAHAVRQCFGTASWDEDSQSRIRKLADEGFGVAVIGAGTIGILVFEILSALGFDNITVIGNREIQRDRLLKLGLSPEKFVFFDEIKKTITPGSGSDIEAGAVFECVGRNETFSMAIELAAPMGRICTVGNPYGDMLLERDVYWKIPRKQLQITGTWNSSFTKSEDDDWHFILKLLAEKKLNPTALVSHSIPFDELENALVMMRDKTEEYIKVQVS